MKLQSTVSALVFLFGFSFAVRAQDSAPDQSYYQVISDYSLFRPLGWKKPDTSPKYQLIATKIPAQGVPKALIKESRSNKTYYVSVGEKIEDAKVEKIEANQVSLDSGGESIELKGRSVDFLRVSGKKKDRKDRDRKEEATKRSRGGKKNERSGRRGRGGWGRGNWDSGRGKEMRAKWESMSPERRAQMIQKFRSASSGERREMMGRFMRGGKD